MEDKVAMPKPFTLSGLDGMGPAIVGPPIVKDRGPVSTSSGLTSPTTATSTEVTVGSSWLKKPGPSRPWNSCAATLGESPENNIYVSIDDARDLRLEIEAKTTELASVKDEKQALEVANGELVHEKQALEVANGELVHEKQALEVANGELVHEKQALEVANGSLLHANSELEKLSNTLKSNVGEIQKKVATLENLLAQILDSKEETEEDMEGDKENAPTMRCRVCHQQKIPERNKRGKILYRGDPRFYTCFSCFKVSDKNAGHTTK